MLLSSPSTYFATLPVMDHSPLPVGSHTKPKRGLNAVSFATCRPCPFAPLFLSHLRPMLAERRELTCQLSLRNAELVRNVVPSLEMKIGCQRIVVVAADVNWGNKSVPRTISGALRMR